MSTKTLTEAQERTLKALELLTADGWPVSVRELCSYLDRGTANTHTHLVNLERLGYATRHERRDGWKPT